MPENRKYRTPHTVTLEIEPGWGIRAKSHCPYPANDPHRPCWPVTETGAPVTLEEGTRDGCVYSDYISEEGFDAFEGEPISLTLPFHTKWLDCYTPRFKLGEEP